MYMKYEETNKIRKNNQKTELKTNKRMANQDNTVKTVADQNDQKRF